MYFTIVFLVIQFNLLTFYEVLDNYVYCRFVNYLYFGRSVDWLFNGTPKMLVNSRLKIVPSIYILKYIVKYSLPSTLFECHLTASKVKSNDNKY